ncbi:IS982 family transposase [Tenacibaculum tangerinum]|uniref:IS982 family transposase n=1 Tax=Tenacibaculum tangerinum TaxID=3038772 RepID=A0ABY8KZC0_9FLAO|nr:IS982 family transposase [Tenacibaculum tangerinum]WGH74217.1 IS982 family transposase [Tenacibaculum tangerinum]WGH74576.1 IS982 family transposase [Tenacibaculum tangerinum]
MISDFKITEFFCLIDDFCAEINQVIDKNALETCSKIVRRRKPKLTQSEIITIMVLFHFSGFRCFKHFYIEYVSKHLSKEFPDLVSYNRFVELKKRCSVPMILFLQMHCLGQCTGISFLDSTTIKVCHYKREKQNKVFKNTAKKGKGTMGWFFGFKLHIIINEKGDIVDFLITQGNIDDRQPLKDKAFHNRVFGKIFADRGYVGKELFEQLFVDGIHLVTKIRKNMKNTLMHIYDKIMLRKRAVIESVNDILKNVCQIEHTRHRSFDNFILNLVAGLIAYSFYPTKPNINIDNLQRIG